MTSVAASPSLRLAPVSTSLLETAPATDFSAIHSIQGPIEIASANRFAIIGPQPGRLQYVAGGALRSGERFDPEKVYTPAEIGRKGFQHTMAVGLLTNDGMSSAASSATAAGLAQALHEMTGATVLAIRTTNTAPGDAGGADRGPIGAGNEALFTQFDFYVSGMSKADFLKKFGEAGGIARAQSLARERIGDAGPQWLPDFFKNGAIAAGITKLLSDIMNGLRLNWGF